MSELERLNEFTSEYVALVNKYKLSICSCCCAALEVENDLYDALQLCREIGDFCYIGDIKFVFDQQEMKWKKNE